MQTRPQKKTPMFTRLLWKKSSIKGPSTQTLSHTMKHRSHVKYRGTHYGSQTVWLTDEGWQKAMPKQIELWDISALDSFNKQRARGGHRGRGSGQWGLAQHPEEGVGQGGEGRWGWRGAGVHEALWCHRNVSPCQVQSSLAVIFWAIRVLILRTLASWQTRRLAEGVPHSYTGHTHTHTHTHTVSSGDTHRRTIVEQQPGINTFLHSSPVFPSAWLPGPFWVWLRIWNNDVCEEM